MKMKNPCIHLFSAMLALLLAMPMAATAAAKAPAASAKAAVAAPVAGSAWSEKRTLREFARSDVQRFLMLRQAEARYPLSIPVPYRIAPTRVTAHIAFTNSNSLLRGRSQLILRWNDGAFGQAALDPAYPDGVVDVPVPVGMLHGGDNTLTLEVSQHYRDDCEDQGAPELWTSIDMDASYIELTGTLKPIPAQLGGLDHLLANTSWGAQHLVMAPLGKSEAHLHAGTMLAQALALKSGGQQLSIDAVADFPGLAALPAGRDVVLFGLASEAAALPGFEPIVAGNKGRLTLLPRPNDAGHFLLLVLADKAEDLVDVAGALAWAKLPMQTESSFNIQGVEAPEALAYTQKHAAFEGREYSFSDLGFKTQTLQGMKDYARVTMWLPPDLFAKSHENVELRLHFAYAANLRSDSSMKIYHNGHFLRSIGLNAPGGLDIAGYRIWLPLYTFRPGLNEFEFEVDMQGNTPSKCVSFDNKNLKLTMFEDSALIIPDIAHFVAMPDLHFTLNTGFPYLNEQTGEAAPVIQVPSLNNELLGSAWTLAAKLGQLKGMPNRALTVATNADNAANVILLSSLKLVSPELWTATPIDLGEKGVINHPVFTDPAALGHEPTTFLMKLFMLLPGHAAISEDPRQGQKVVRIRHDVHLLNSGIMMQFENPKHLNGTMTMLVADSDEQLRGGIDQLVQLWPLMNDAHGDALFWGKRGQSEEPDFVAVTISEKSYHIGNMNYLQRISYFATRYPEFLIGFFVTLVVGMALLTRWLLVRYRRRTHPTIEP